MPKTIAFVEEHNYANERAVGITIPIMLSVSPERKIKLLAKVDTGAAHCLFRPDRAEALGLRLEDGQRETFHTAVGEFEAFGHMVTVHSFRWTFDAMVYFAREDIRREVLGRAGWIQNFRLGIVDHDSMLYLAHYND
jgi:hypothetical protein